MKTILGADGSVKYMVTDAGSELIIQDGKTGELLYKYIKASDQTLRADGSLYMYGNVLLDLGD